MLSGLTVTRAAAKDKDYLLFDDDGLYLRVRKSGKKSWTVRFLVEGKLKQKAIGDYPEITLIEARKVRDELKQLVRSGQPVQPQGRTFADVAAEWYEKRQAPRLTPKHLATVKYRLEHYLEPLIGNRLVNELTRQDIIQALLSIADRGVIETSRRAAGIVEQVFCYAQDIGIIDLSVAQNLVRALPSKKSENFKSTSDLKEIARLMRAIVTIDSFLTRTALQLYGYTFLRASELLEARWSEIDFDKALWTLPANHMKRRREHVVPLARQVVVILKDLKDYDRKMVYHDQDMTDGFLFPTLNPRKEQTSMTEAAVLKALKMLCYQHADNPDMMPPKMTIHGFRHMASTLLNEAGWNRDAIERQLSHVEGGVRAVYNKAEYMDIRRPMMQWYADFLDALRDGKETPERPKL